MEFCYSKVIASRSELNFISTSPHTDVDGDAYVKYNAEKAIKYLKYKISKLNQCLKANLIQVTDNFVKVAGLDSKHEEARESK